MSYRPFRFLHAADLHLDTPPVGMSYIPTRLQAPLLGAAGESLVRMTNAAIAENVDFVVLAGDVIQADQAEPRLFSQIHEQFSRLAEADISVYWAGGKIDPPGRWPTAIELPESTHRFPTGAVTRIKHARDGRPLAEIVGSSQQRKRNIQPKDYVGDGAALPMVSVAYGAIDARKADKLLASHDTPSYWALGGQHLRDTLLTGDDVVHYSGTTQGRSPAETGSHGVTLVEFDQDGAFHTAFIETDVVRWCDETFELDELMSTDDFEQMVRTRLDTVAEKNAAQTTVVDCSVVGQGDVLDELRVGSLASDFVEMLRADYAQRERPLWVSGLRVAPSQSPNAEFQDTILGDYLATIAACETGEQSLDFSSLESSTKQLERLSIDFDLSDSNELMAILASARSRGIDLLGGSPPEDAVAVGGSR